MIVDLAVYTDGVRVPGALSIAECRGPIREPGSFVWLGLYEPTFDELESVRYEFNLHELAVEDTVHAHQRPKVEVYGDTLFVVLRTARYIDETESVEFGEIQVFLGDGFVISVRHSEASKLGETRREIEADPDLLRKGPSAVLYAIVDRVVDDYVPVIDGIENDLGEVEAEVFTHLRTNPAERIFKLKREVLEFARNSDPLTEAVDALSGGSHPQINPELQEYFRDVADHLIRSNARVDAIGALLSDALNANLAHVSVRQNEDMRTISAWVAIAAIPTVIGAIFGMNFEHMPELEQRWTYPTVLVLIVVLCGFVFWRFRRAGWIGPR